MDSVGSELLPRSWGRGSFRLRAHLRAGGDEPGGTAALLGHIQAWLLSLQPGSEELGRGVCKEHQLLESQGGNQAPADAA